MVNAQLDRIEAKLDRLLALLDKPARAPLAPIVQYSPEFDKIWADYPKRAGSNPKQAAYKAFRARLREGVDPESIRAGVTRYRAFCEATGKQGTEYAMTASRFFGPGREWEQDWAQPPPEAIKPKSDEEWLALGRQRGIAPKTGEPWNEYKNRVLGGHHEQPRIDPKRADTGPIKAGAGHAAGRADVLQLL
jgi:hypothetical protein